MLGVGALVVICAALLIYCGPKWAACVFERHSYQACLRRKVSSAPPDAPTPDAEATAELIHCCEEQTL